MRAVLFDYPVIALKQVMLRKVKYNKRMDREELKSLSELGKDKL